MLFSNIIGQEPIKEHLIQTVQSGRLSHAQMFSGFSGTGKLPMAIAYAQYIFCENKQKRDACGVCLSCKKVASLTHPDLHFIFPTIAVAGYKENGSDNFIKEWREKIIENQYFDMIQWSLFIDPNGTKQLTIYKDDSDKIIRQLNVKSYEGGYKIVILWLPEKLNLVAANKLLKIIEEPFPKTLFILVSEDTDKVLPTIISRTQLVKFPKLSLQEIERYLSDKYPTFSSSQLNHFAHIAGGSITEAEKIVQSNMSDENSLLQDFMTYMRLSYQFDFREILNFCDILNNKGKEYLKNYFLYSLRLLRENFLMNIRLKNLNSLSKEEQKFSENFYTFITPKNIGQLLEAINTAYLHIERNGNIKLILFDLATKSGQLLRKSK